MINQLTSATDRLLEQGLDVASRRHQVLANNIANVDTPGFKRSGINFEEVMAKAVEQESWRRGGSDPHPPEGGQFGNTTPPRSSRKTTPLSAMMAITLISNERWPN